MVRGSNPGVNPIRFCVQTIESGHIPPAAIFLGTLISIPRFTRMKIPAIKIHQWLDDWDKIKFEKSLRRSKPEPHFYLFALPARDLRALCGIYPRTADGRKRGQDDTGIQRRHDEDRSAEIQEFVRFGHPWAGLSKAQRKSDDYSDLKKPGWLPTAIVVNILKPGDTRNSKSISSADSIRLESRSDTCSIVLPNSFSGPEWRAASGVAPIEVIDGQHRLWSFEDLDAKGEFELPVVAFYGLDVSWQAYLFYTINIKPKRINSSLAFDLYPLLRTEDWLEKFEGAAVYRETRAQELVDLLYSHPESPWHNRINMLGESGRGETVTQAAWIRSLLATFVKSWEGKRVSIGGVFGAPVGSHKQVLPWSRHEQAAVLISIGLAFKAAVKSTRTGWTKSLREQKQQELFKPDDDPAFAGRHTLISQDQGIRALLNISNDFLFLHADDLNLESWGDGGDKGDPDERLISTAIASFSKTPAHSFLEFLSIALAEFDWRASSAPGLTEDESLKKAAYRGSGGYRDLRRQLLLHLEKYRGNIGNLAKSAIDQLGYD